MKLIDREKVKKELLELNAKAYGLWVHDQKNDFLAQIGNVTDDVLALLKEQEHKDRMFHALEDDWKRLKELLKEQEAMNVDAFVQWCSDSHIMGDATVSGIKYWVGKYKEIKKGR